MKKVLLLFGGREEAEISKISAKYIYDILMSDGKTDLYCVSVDSNNRLNFFDLDKNTRQTEVLLTREGLSANNQFIKIDYCIPCIHGYPGESGDIQSMLELLSIPYMGNNAETSRICFNKITTKLWLEKLGIDTTPFEIISPVCSPDQIKSIFKSFNQDVFIKSSSQGSSIGCYPANNIETYNQSISLARRYCPQILVEKKIKAREIEVAVFEYQNKIIVTNPGEVINGENFYSYDDKYSSKSNAKTTLSPILENSIKDKIKKLSRIAFETLNLKDLSRIDFFLSEDGKIYLNEINTFPGLTEISLFPKLLQTEGITFNDYLIDRIYKQESDIDK